MEGNGDKSGPLAGQNSPQSAVVLRCSQCETPWAHLHNGVLVVYSKHHGQKHINRVAVSELVGMCQEGSALAGDVGTSKYAARIWIAASERWPGVNPATKMVEVTLPGSLVLPVKMEEREVISLEDIGGGLEIGYSERLDILAVRM